jgi:uncharacterized BrkB/YihY/UPF0761 family membrane protein
MVSILIVFIIIVFIIIFLGGTIWAVREDYKDIDNKK